MKEFSSHVFMLLPVAVLAACESAAPRAETPPSTETVSVLVPSLSPLPETKTTQERGGIRIELGPAPFKAIPETQSSRGAAERASFSEIMNRHCPAGALVVAYAVTKRTVFKVQPDHVEFLVKVHNNLPRVFRGAGAVVQFQVGGKSQVIPQEAYAELTNAIVAPRDSAEFRIQGPAVDQLTVASRLGVFLFDVITSTDTAGNVKEKYNFEWFYNYARVREDRSASVTHERVLECESHR